MIRWQTLFLGIKQQNKRNQHHFLSLWTLDPASSKWSVHPETLWQPNNTKQRTTTLIAPGSENIGKMGQIFLPNTSSNRA
jgi:hypothetical protein